jgi:S-formylglutathione hydrolase FrmB
MALVLGLSNANAWASWRKDSSELLLINRKLKGQLVDHTANHGHDNRIWSRSLGEKRDLYIYLPPNFDPGCRYPIVIFMHGFGQDEQLFLRMVVKIDEAMSQGRMPPHIIAVPDGSLSGEPNMLQPGSFFINSMAGDFENWILQDVWDFVCDHYPIRPEREAHVLAGVSMGGFAAFNMGIRHRNAFGVAVGVHPPLNLRWCDLNGNYFANFDPRCWGWRHKLEDRREPVAKFYGGLVKFRLGNLVEPLFGFGDDAIEEIARQNPIELIDATHLRNGELAMFVGYGGEDEFNIDAQVESFLYLAKARGLSVAVAYEPHGHHDSVTASRLFRSMVEWLAPRLRPYAPN